MNKKIIITGGNGFIGSHLVKEITQNKSQPILLLRKKSDLRRLKDVKGFKSFVVSSCFVLHFQSNCHQAMHIQELLRLPQ